MKNKLLLIGLLAVLTLSALGAVRTRVHTIFEKVSAKRLIMDLQAATCVDNAVGSNPGSYTISTPAKSQYQMTNADTDGCEIFIGETSVTDGEVLEIINVGAQAVSVPEQTNAVEGSGTSTLGQYDAVAYRYIGDRWIQLGPEGDN